MGLFVILMGVQGSGKGEQARFMQETYGIPQISTGDLFRAMKTREDEFARRVQQMMAEGTLIDDATTNEIVRQRLAEPDAQAGAIFDGYPRTPAQAAWLDEHLASKDERLAAVLLLDIDLFTAFKRAFGRVTTKAGVGYNLYSKTDGVTFEWVEHPQGNHPPRLKAVVTATGEELHRRPDDAHAHAIIKRMDTFVATTAPLIAYYESKGLVQRVPAELPIEQVSADIRAILDAAAKG
jgi:adenylate kinase